MTSGSTRASRGRRVARACGTALIVLGALALVWGFTIWRWGDPVSSLYTSWQQRKLASQYEQVQRSFAHDAPEIVRATSGPAPPKPAAIAHAARVYHRRVHEGDAIGRIRVPELGLNMILVAGTDSSSLRKGPGWDERTYLPGEGQLVYIAGHRTTYKAPFAHIDRLKAGQRVELDLPYGRFTYRITRSVIVPATDLSRLRSHGSEEVALQACHPRFSARERYIVYAKPIHYEQPDVPGAAAARGRPSAAGA